MRRFRRFRLRLRLPVGRPARLPVIGWLRWYLVIAACLYLLLRLVEHALLGPLGAVAETEARERGIAAVHQILVASVGKELRPVDLILYEKDQEGRIAAYRVNTREVNQVAARAAAAVKDEFSHFSEASFGIPLGALTGSHLLGTLGPRVPVRMLPIGTVAVEVKQEFQGEGINQTRHRIWLQATANVRVLLPILSREVTVTAEVPIADTVIVGPVPSGFYGSNLGGVTVPAQSE